MVWTGKAADMSWIGAAEGWLWRAIVLDHFLQRVVVAG
jgi:hypothetical protein